MLGEVILPVHLIAVERTADRNIGTWARFLEFCCRRHEKGVGGWTVGVRFAALDADGTGTIIGRTATGTTWVSIRNLQSS
jgi:hypothetical protein